MKLDTWFWVDGSSPSAIAPVRLRQCAGAQLCTKAWKIVIWDWFKLANGRWRGRGCGKVRNHVIMDRKIMGNWCRCGTLGPMSFGSDPRFGPTMFEASKQFDSCQEKEGLGCVKPKLWVSENGLYGCYTGIRYTLQISGLFRRNTMINQWI